MDEMQWAKIQEQLESAGWSLDECDELNRKVTEVEGRWLFSDH